MSSFPCVSIEVCNARLTYWKAMRSLCGGHLGGRIDYALTQTSYLSSEYLSLVHAHGSYWRSGDVCAFVMRRLLGFPEVGGCVPTLSSPHHTSCHTRLTSPSVSRKRPPRTRVLLLAQTPRGKAPC